MKEKQTPAKRGGAAGRGGKKSPAKKATPAKAAPAKVVAAKKGTAARGGRGGRGAAKAAPARKRAATPSSEEESIASDFEDHPPPIQTKGRGASKAARGKAAAKSPAKPVNKAAKKAVPISIVRGGGRSVRERAPAYYGTPSPEYDDSDASVDEPPPKRSPKKASPAKRGRGAAASPAKRGVGRGAAASPAKRGVE